MEALNKICVTDHASRITHLPTDIMNIPIPKTIPELKQHLKDPLYKNSFFLVLSRVFNVACGFFFWMLAARLYSIEDVGLATALIASLGLVILFSRFGLDFSLIRFLPIKDKSNVFNTCLLITTIASFIVGIIYILGVGFFSSSLSFIQNPIYAIIFLTFVVMNSITMMTGFTFIASRKAEHRFFQFVFLASRIPLLIPLVFLGCFGIFCAAGLAYLFASLFAFFLLSKSIGFNLKIDKPFVRESFRFSSGNYIANVLLLAPTLILPIMILNLLGEAEAAKYYITFAIGNLALIIPDALSTSLFVEGSHGESLRRNIIRAGLAIYAILIPAIVILYFFGGFLLGLFGTEYVETFELLKLLVISSLFVAVYLLFIPIQNVRMKVESIVKLNAVRFLLLLGLCYVFILKLGIVGVGYAWMITYGILGLGIVVVAKRERWV